MDLTKVAEVRPVGAPVGPPLSGREKAGIYLAFTVLGIIAVFLLLTVVMLWWVQSRGGDLWHTDILVHTSAPGTQTALDTTAFRLLQDDRIAFREFWLKLSQMVLLNLLLPVLTALLGYIFGTHSGRQRD